MFAPFWLGVGPLLLFLAGVFELATAGFGLTSLAGVGVGVESILAATAGVLGSVLLVFMGVAGVVVATDFTSSSCVGILLFILFKSKDRNRF